MVRTWTSATAASASERLLIASDHNLTKAGNAWVSAIGVRVRDGASFDEAIDVTSHALPDVSAEGFSDAVATLRAKLDTLLPGDDRKTDASQAAQVASAKWSAIEARVKAGTLLPPRDQLVSCNL